MGGGGELGGGQVLVTARPVADESMPGDERVVADRSPAQLAPAAGDAAVRLERQAAVEPDAACGGHQPVHHGDVVVRRRRDAQQLLAARHCRVVDRLQVDAVRRHQLVGQLHHQLRVPDLRQTDGQTDGRTYRSVRTTDLLNILSRLITTWPPVE